LAKWVVNAALSVKGSSSAPITDKISKSIIEASGAQFPVSGVVWEDMDGTGLNVFPFRHGVTVHIAGMSYMQTWQPSVTDFWGYINGTVSSTGKYGRIISTTCGMYLAWGGSSQCGNNPMAWPGTVKDAYQRAWGSDKNDLITAWVKSNM